MWEINEKEPTKVPESTVAFLKVYKHGKLEKILKKHGKPKCVKVKRELQFVPEL